MTRTIQIPSEISNLRLVEKAIDEISGEVKIKKESYGKILVAAMEAVNNAIVHGNKSDISKNVRVTFILKESEMEIEVEDKGTGFDPSLIPDPTKPENIENISGRGVFLMSRLADKIEFNDKGNIVKMIFKDI
ncbi:MAG: ATP-binding protein [Bacteroidales bacterium]